MFSCILKLVIVSPFGGDGTGESILSRCSGYPTPHRTVQAILQVQSYFPFRVLALEECTHTPAPQVFCLLQVIKRPIFSVLALLSHCCCRRKAL